MKMPSRTLARARGTEVISTWLVVHALAQGCTPTISRQREKRDRQKIQPGEPQYLGDETKENQQREVQWQSHL